VFGGTKQYMPLRMLQAGVMPIIFSTTLLIFPYLIFQFFGQVSPGAVSTLFESAANAFQPGHLLYNLANVGLIFFFCFFWTAIMFNPKEIADNLKESGAFIPGHRPGKRTEEYLDRVMHRVTFVGAAFLSVIAVVPTILTYLFPNVNYMIASFYGGTGLLIAVSVSYDLISKIDSYLLMRNHKSLLE
jgi:preprotein translocase subunit SecY